MGFRREKVTAPVVTQLGLHSGRSGIPNSCGQPSLSFSHSPKSDIVRAEMLVLTHRHKHCHELPTVGQLGSVLARLHPSNVQLQHRALKREIIATNITEKPDKLRKGQLHQKDLLLKATGIRRMSPEEAAMSTSS